MTAYLYHLFLEKEKELSRHEYLTALSMLWFLGIASFTSLISSSLVNFLISTGGSSSYFLINSFNYWNNTLFWVRIPWLLFMFLGCMLLVNRVYRSRIHSLPLILTMGVIAFVGIRAIWGIPANLTGGFGTLEVMASSFSEDLYEEATILVKTLSWILIPACLFGLGILLAPLSWLDKVSPKLPSLGITRESFAQKYALLSLLSILVHALALYFLLTKFGQMDSIFFLQDRSLQWAIALGNLLFLIAFLVILVKRLQHAEKSPWSLLILLAPILWGLAIWYSFIESPNIWLAFISPYLTYFFLEVPFVFIAWLFLVPGEEDLSLHPSAESTP